MRMRTKQQTRCGRSLRRETWKTRRTSRVEDVDRREDVDGVGKSRML
jgi:hypothetical protein